MLVKSLVALATEKMLLKTSGKTFLRGIDFMYVAGLAPERLSVMMTTSGKYVLQFHSKCDIRPFAANYPSFTRVLRGIVHVRAWRIKSIEFVNVAFDIKDVENLERTIDKLGVELVLLRNCTYPHVRRGEEAIRFLNALNRKKQAVVCEYGDDRLKHRISRRSRGATGAGGGPLVVAPPAIPAPLAEHAANAMARAVQQEIIQNAQAAAAAMERRRNMPYQLRRRDRNGLVAGPQQADNNQANPAAARNPPQPLNAALQAQAQVEADAAVAAAVSPQFMMAALRRFAVVGAQVAVRRRNRDRGERAIDDHVVARDGAAEPAVNDVDDVVGAQAQDQDGDVPMEIDNNAGQVQQDAADDMMDEADPAPRFFPMRDDPDSSDDEEIIPNREQVPDDDSDSTDSEEERALAEAAEGWMALERAL